MAVCRKRLIDLLFLFKLFMMHVRAIILNRILMSNTLLEPDRAPFRTYHELSGVCILKIK
jgi:hypothetical protein